MKKLSIVLAVMILSACGKQETQPVPQAQYLPPAQQYAQPAPVPAPQVQYAPPAPVIVQAAPAAAAPAHNNMVQDMLIGGMLGHMIGSSGGGGRAAAAAPAPAPTHTTVVNKTYVNKTYEAPRPAAPTPRRSFSSPSRSGGGRR